MSDDTFDFEQNGHRYRVNVTAVPFAEPEAPTATLAVDLDALDAQAACELRATIEGR